MADTNINEINEAADNGTFLQAAFEVIVSNSKNNDTQNVTGVAVDGNGDPIQAVSGDIYVIDDTTLNEGYTAASLKNTNTVYMKLSANSTVEGRPGDHTGLYVHNTYDVNKITDGSLVVNFPGKILGLVTLAGERSDYTELIVGEKYKFAISNFYEVDTYEVGDTFTVKNGVWKQTAFASITAGDVYAVLTKISSFTEGGLYAGDGFVLEIKRKAVADTVGSVVVANPTLAGTEPDLTGLEVDGEKYKISPVVETTYAELKALRDGGELTPGTFYRITDYVTKIVGTYDLSDIGAQGYLHWGKSAEHPFDIIVQAVDDHTLSENARAALHSGDTYFQGADIDAWELKYCLDNDAKVPDGVYPRFAFADTVNGKGVIYWMKDEWNNQAGYDFKNVQFIRYALKLADAQGSYQPQSTGLDYNPAGELYNRYGSFYHIFTALQGYMATGTYVNPFKQQAVVDGVVTDVNNYDFYVGYNILGTIQFPTVDASYLSSFNADWYYTFDYYDVTDSVHYDASFNLFSRVPCRENYLEIETDPLMALVESNFTVIGIGSNTWETSSVFVSGLSENAWASCSDNKLSMHNWANTFGANCYSNTFGDSCYSNTFGDRCYSNTFGYNCYSNTFGDRCYSNTFGDSCYSNTFGNNCNSNTFGDSCYSNTFGDSCDSNTFGYNCYSNTFGDSCNSNTFGDSCYSNTFGNDCDGNTFGYSCYSNTFGNDCDGNTFGTFNQNNHLHGSFSYITGGDGVQQVTFPSSMQDIQYMKEIYNYTPSVAQKATFITHTGYNQTTVVSTTDGGQTWA